MTFGFSEPRPIVDSDPPEMRKNAHRRIVSFLERTGLVEFSAPERIEQIRALSPENFRELATRLNGLLREVPIKDRGQDDESSSIVQQNDFVDYSPPTIKYVSPKLEHAWRLLNAFFSDMSENISQENMPRYAVKLEYAMVFAHPFDDANGRTSKYLGRLFAEGKVKEEDARTSLGDSFTGAGEANKLALFELFKEYVPEKYQQLWSFKCPKDLLDYSYSLSDALKDHGYGSPLKVLARIMNNPDVPAHHVMDPDQSKRRDKLKRRMNFTDADIEKHEEKEQQIYAELQEKLFWKVQELLDDEQDLTNVDETFRNRVKKLNRVRYMTT